jgi:hypothetical protein
LAAEGFAVLMAYACCHPAKYLRGAHLNRSFR